MKRNIYELKYYLIEPVCDCGGPLEEVGRKIDVPHQPKDKKHFRCRNCGKSHFLAREDWPTRIERRESLQWIRGK